MSAEPKLGYLCPTGFKQTEIGVIPEDWDVIPMGKVSECLIGLTYSPLDVSDFGTLVLRSSNVQNGRLAFDDNVFVDMDVPARAITRENDILICVRNGSRQLIGKCALIDAKTAGSAFGAFMSVLRSDSAKFLFFQFQSNIQKRQIDEVMGATINQITNKNMAAFKVIWPPTKAEQEAIAEALSDADALIESLEQLITKKRHLKQGAMQELLTGKKRLPGFRGEWEVKRLGDLIFSFQNGYGFSAVGYVKGGIPIVTMSQIGLDGSFQFDENSVNFWESYELNSLKSFHINNGDVIIAMTDVTPAKNLIGRMAIVKSNQILLLNQRVGHLRIDKTKINPMFLISLSNMKEWRDYSIASASLGVQANIGTKDILKGTVKLPPIDEQTTIAIILSDMDTEIAALETKLAKTRSLKQGMMHNLLTGRIRLL